MGIGVYVIDQGKEVGRLGKEPVISEGECKGGFRRALMGRLDTGHVSACALELDLIDLPHSGLAAKENHLSNILLGTF